MKNLDFSLIDFKRPNFIQDDIQIPRFIGVDSEADIHGCPFLICFSDGESCGFEDLPQKFFLKKYRDAHFVLYNLQYDSGALLYHLPDEKKRELWEMQTCEHGGFCYEYIPHKCLTIWKDTDTKKENIKFFWDILQFYDTSLDNAAKKYLNRGKIEVETKRFTAEYIEKNIKALTEYCIRDASLTADLSDYLKSKLNEFGIDVSRLYSSAFLSFQHFLKHGQIVTVYRFWQRCRDLLKCACEAYQGGKFEVTHRGTFQGIEYDIVSAYPFEISNLVDISHCRVFKSNKYQADSIYGFIRCRIRVKKEIPLPHSVLFENVNIYPVGEYYSTLTKKEYEWMIEKGLDVSIITGYWIFVNNISYPYRERVLELFKLKDYYKGKDAMLYSITKIMLNGFYGKMVQLIEQPDGRLKAFAGWNPIYGAIITANTRLRVTEYQYRFPGDCLAVHTDSIMMKKPVDEKELSNELGGLKREVSGEGLLIASGIYDIADKTAYRGTKLKKGESWKSIIEKNPECKSIGYRQNTAISWTQAMAWNKPELINVFMKTEKQISFNADVKRIWYREVKGRDLLEGLEKSSPRIIVESENPF